MARVKRLAAALLGLAVPAVLLAGCGSSGGATGAAGDNPVLASPTPSAAPVTSASPVSAPAGQVACSWAPSSQDAGTRRPGLPPATVPDTGSVTATLKTNRGTIAFTIDRTKTPCTAGSFAWLAGKGYFTNSPCHRLTTSGIFVLQCGDPTGTGSGGPGYTIPDENLTGATYPAGTVAMANTGSPHTGGGQFFLVYADTQLPASYTPFGTVTTGLDLLKTVAKGGTDDANGPGDGHPKTSVTISSFTIG